MEGDIGKVNILYRMAEKKAHLPKNKPAYINNRTCLKNAFKNLGDTNNTFIIFGDKLKESKALAIANCDHFFETKSHGNSKTMLEVLDYAMEHYQEDDIVYFLEDDYLHREGYAQIIREGLERADYVSLYDHPDKYSYDPTALIFHTKSTHWRFCHSTTMTFATKMKTLVFDYKIFKQGLDAAEIPPDFQIWDFLTKNLQRTLVTPIPGYSTHGEAEFLSPLIDWEKIK